MEPKSGVNRGNAGKGRKLGSRNKLTGAHGDLIQAWDQVAGPQTAREIMKAAVDEARGKEVKTTDEDGNETVKIVRNFEPLRSVLPYIARKMPETLELAPLESMDPDEIERRWSLRQDRKK